MIKLKQLKKECTNLNDKEFAQKGLVDLYKSINIF